MTQHNDNKYCDNQRVNDLLIAYERLAEAKHIRFEVERGLDVREVAPVSDDDLAAVFRIALNHAIAGCEALPEDRERFIQVWGESFPKWIMGVVHSSAPVKLECKWGRPLEISPEMEYLFTTLERQDMMVGCCCEDGLFRLHFTYRPPSQDYAHNR